MAAVYVLEITLIGLFFLIRNTENKVVGAPQAIIMIVAIILTGNTPRSTISPPTSTDQSKRVRYLPLCLGNDVESSL